MEPGLEPDPNVYCDFPTCTRRDSTVMRLACFHCFHQSCISSHDCCPICLVPLKKKVEKLVNTFNTGLLTSNDTAAFESNEDIHDEERISTPAAMSVTEAQSFYSSAEWATKVHSTVNSYATVPLPSHPNHNHSSAQPTVHESNSNTPSHVLTPITIQPYHDAVMSPTGLSNISFLNLQSLKEQEVMHAHLLPFYLAKCFFHPMSTFQQLGVH